MRHLAFVLCVLVASPAHAQDLDVDPPSNGNAGGDAPAPTEAPRDDGDDDSRSPGSAAGIDDGSGAGPSGSAPVDGDEVDGDEVDGDDVDGDDVDRGPSASDVGHDSEGARATSEGDLTRGLLSGTLEAEPSTASDAAPADEDAALRAVVDVLRIIRPTLLGEIDYRLYAREQEGQSGFALGRFRMGLILEPAPWLRAVGTVEWVGENPQLLDAFVSVRPLPWLELGLGYMKAPLFASFRHEPVLTLPFPDRAPVVRAFWIRRDVGLDVRFAPHEAPVEAIVRIGNGSGSILGNDSPLPAGYASLDLVLGRAWVGAANGDRDFGLRLGAAGMVESVRDRDGITGMAPLGFVYYRPVVVSGLRLVGEAHAVGYLGPVRVTFEGAIAQEDRSRDDDGNPATPRLALPSVLSSGLTAELAWVILGGHREVGRAPTTAREEGSDWSGGALEIAARFDALFLGWGAPDVSAGGALAGAVSLKWWPIEFLAVDLAGHLMHYDVPPIETPTEHWSWDALLRVSVFWGQTARVSAAD